METADHDQGEASMPSTPDPTSSPTRLAALPAWLLACASTSVVMLSTLLAVAPAHAARARVASVALTRVTVTGVKLTVTGRVTLPLNTAGERKRTEVALTLTDGPGKLERFTARLNAKDRFTATHVTKLTGALGLGVLVKIAGRQSGRKLVKTISVAASSKPGTPGGATPGATAPGSPGPSTQGTQLVGLFQLQAGQQAVSGALSGTYFRMIGVKNGNSTALDQNYTLLSPGTDGGFETDAFQEPPTPAFASITPANQPTGDALANRIVQPQKFFGVNFSIVTAPTDLQAGLPDPLPQIVDSGGVLSGQVTDWTAQWNGLSFNQGSPKPNGAYPTGGLPASIWGGGGTIALQGTYSAATGRFVLEWQSLIEGGPFNGFTGQWHLEGTFVPRA
jgi:hypothetical protein